jgi:hypothetical protein
LKYQRLDLPKNIFASAPILIRMKAMIEPAKPFSGPVKKRWIAAEMTSAPRLDEAAPAGPVEPQYDRFVALRHQAAPAVPCLR